MTKFKLKNIKTVGIISFILGVILFYMSYDFLPVTLTAFISGLLVMYGIADGFIDKGKKE